jgi:hypothetical protein
VISPLSLSASARRLSGPPADPDRARAVARIGAPCSDLQPPRANSRPDACCSPLAPLYLPRIGRKGAEAEPARADWTPAQAGGGFHPGPPEPGSLWSTWPPRSVSAPLTLPVCFGRRQVKACTDLCCTNASSEPDTSPRDGCPSRSDCGRVRLCQSEPPDCCLQRPFRPHSTSLSKGLLDVRRF